MRGVLLVVLGLAVAGCARQAVLAPASDEALQLHGLLGLMLVVCAIAYALVLGFLGHALWRAHRRASSDEAVRSDRALGRSLGAWAALIFVGLGVIAGASFLVDRTLALADERAVDVRVTAHQWWWRVEYRDPSTGGWIEAANELHLPLGVTTRVEIRSADVIHSFWIPSLAGKVDMVPGRTNHLEITPRQVGWFQGQCAEFCGLQHARMALEVQVEDPAARAAWLAQQARPAPAPATNAAARGLAHVTGGPCATCHTIRGTAAQGRAGPDLTHLASRRRLAAGTLPMTRGGLAGWIAQPQALKPGAEMPPASLAPADSLAVVAYLETLR